MVLEKERKYVQNDFFFPPCIFREQYTLSDCVCGYDRARGSAVPKEPARNGILYIILRAVMALLVGRVCDQFIKIRIKIVCLLCKLE